MLRQPMTAPTQQYDPNGNSPTASAIGPWTVYGRMQIKKIRVESNRLVVEGQRIGMKFSDHAKLLVPTKLDEKVRLEISLSQPVNSADQVHEIFSHLFVFSKEEFLASVPEFWRWYLTKYLDSYEEDGTRLVFKPYVPEKIQPKKASADPEAPKDGIFHVGNGVTAPKPRYQPDPDYPAVAKREGFVGHPVFTMIVDKTGSVSKPVLVQPAGLGLDENAYQAMRTWKFQPATRNGQPVAVEVNAEFTFDLY